jgi:hypothetical protein
MPPAWHCTLMYSNSKGAACQNAIFYGGGLGGMHGQVRLLQRNFICTLGAEVSGEETGSFLSADSTQAVMLYTCQNKSDSRESWIVQ